MIDGVRQRIWGYIAATMNTEDEVLKLVDARRLIASGFTRQVRQAAGLSFRQCAAAIDNQTSDVTIYRWEATQNVPGRKADAAIAYVAFIKQVLTDAATF